MVKATRCLIRAFGLFTSFGYLKEEFHIPVLIYKSLDLAMHSKKIKLNSSELIRIS